MRLPPFLRSTIAILSLAALGLAGCSTPRASVGFSLLNVTLADATVQGTTAVFKLRLQNESVYPLVVERAHFRFFLDGALVGEGVLPESVGLRESSPADSAVTVRLADPAQVERLRALLGRGRVSYRIETRLGSGQVDTDDVVSLKTVDIGTVDLH